MVIECKKSNNFSWIFFTRPYVKDLRADDITGQINSSVPRTSEIFWGVDATIRSIVCSGLHYSTFERIAIAYDEQKSKKAYDEQKSKKVSNEDSNKKRNEIFEAVMQLQKFICFDVHKNDDHDWGGEPELVVINMPILVFDDDLFEAFSNLGTIDLQRRQHLLIKTDFLCPYCKKIETFTIDVVNREYFPQFMQILKNDMQESMKNLLKDEQRITDEAKIQRKRFHVE